jgi:HAE1 family hydrophobic/amphiphilic exporter-1
MTSLAFGFGVVPLAIATGAGSGAQRAIGTGVLGGVVTSTLLVTIFAPLFYVLIYKALGKHRKRSNTAPAVEQISGGTSHE